MSEKWLTQKIYSSLLEDRAFEGLAIVDSLHEGC